MWEEVSEAISKATGDSFSGESVLPMGGGCINEAACLEGSGRRYFVKFNRSDLLGMFEAEAEGLAEIRDSHAIRVPEVICSGRADEKSYLVLEYIAMGGHGSEIEMGRQLAQMHRHTRSCFGWHRDNTIGSSPQINTPESEDWVVFYREKRLAYQFMLAENNGAVFSGSRDLLNSISRFFDGYIPEASLLHGDLWGGNVSYDDKGNPVIYDPAVYYGDREAELAFTEMFGGFGSVFYEAYDRVWPLDEGYSTRKELYNLYHVLNHYNLFGGSYAAQADGIINRLLNK